jgi:hypothetical protein
MLPLPRAQDSEEGKLLGGKIPRPQIFLYTAIL